MIRCAVEAEFRRCSMVVLQSCVMYERKWKKDGDLEYLKEFKVVIETSSALSFARRNARYFELYFYWL